MTFQRENNFWGFLGSPKAIAPRIPAELLPFVFIALWFLSVLTFQTVVQTKGPFITAFLTAGLYLITTSGSHAVCSGLFKVLDGRRRNGETYNPWGAGVQGARAGAARKDSQVPCSEVASLIALAFSTGVSVGKGGDEVRPPRHTLRGRVLQNQQHQSEQSCHLPRVAAHVLQRKQLRQRGERTCLESRRDVQLWGSHSGLTAALV